MPMPFRTRALAVGHVDRASRVMLPAAVEVQPGERLLAVRGSGRALGFVARGPIFAEALKHPELEVFGQEMSFEGTDTESGS